MPVIDPKPTDHHARGDTRSLALCFVAALFEGADIVSMGLAATSIAREFGFLSGQIGMILTATVMGLMIGAIAGGWLGDRIGRKRVLVAAFLWLGIFSLLTVAANGLTGFIGVRLLCGLGIGAAFPNLIAIASEASSADRRATNVGLMFCGQPIGGTMLGLFVATQASALDWRSIFLIGGVGPLMLAPVLWFALREPAQFVRAQARGEAGTMPSMRSALFGAGRATTTTSLWVSYAFMQVVVYVINNWLPTLMVAKGFTPQQAGIISAVENIGAAFGCVILARLVDLIRTRTVIVIAYLMICVSVVVMAQVDGLRGVLIAGWILGFFAIGGQLVLYTLAPALYPTLGRATGVGAAVAFGRIGAISGPLAAGGLLAAGVGPGGVLLATLPCVLVSGVAAFHLSRRLSRT